MSFLPWIDLQIGGNEVDSVADEYNLVINAVSGGKNRMVLSRCQEKTTILPTNKVLLQFLLYVVSFRIFTRTLDICVFWPVSVFCIGSIIQVQIMGE